jgi:phage shock protein PspC (stress-responsive transcriptional regulator)
MGETTGGVLRRGSDRILGGVCSGLAVYFGVDVLLVRVIFVILALAPPGIGIILYLVLWFLLEPPEGAPGTTRNLGDRLRAMGQEIKEDFRHGFSHSQAGGPAPPTPPPPPASGASPPPPHPASPPERGWLGPGFRGRPRGVGAGIILIALGAYFLVANVGLLSGFRWDIFWPLVLIAIGLLVLVRRR